MIEKKNDGNLNEAFYESKWIIFIFYYNKYSIYYNKYLILILRNF